MKTVLTIAGSDCGGAGGIQADIKTITAHCLYATSVITSMTAQNTAGVYDILESTPKFLGRQMEAVFEDIFPDAIKIGMVSNEELMRTIAEKLKEKKAKNLVVDVSMVSSSGRVLIQEKTQRIILNEIFPMAEVVFLNRAEAELISGITVDSVEDLGAAAGIISQKYGAKGIFFDEAHKITEKGDMLFYKGRISWIDGTYDSSKKCLGKGCALSASVACRLAEGHSVETSLIKGKEYVMKAVSGALEIGKGKKPLNHFVTFTKE